MSYYYVHDGGRHDFYDDGYDEHYADVESFESHYADEIEGRAEYPVPSSEETPVLLNAPGQLRFPFESGL